MEEARGTAEGRSDKRKRKQEGRESVRTGRNKKIPRIRNDAEEGHEREKR